MLSVQSSTTCQLHNAGYQVLRHGQSGAAITALQELRVEKVVHVLTVSAAYPAEPLLTEDVQVVQLPKPISCDALVGLHCPSSLGLVNKPVAAAYAALPSSQWSGLVPSAVALLLSHRRCYM